MCRIRTAFSIFLLSSTLLIPLAAQAPGTISTVAGCGPNNVPALAANLNDPEFIREDSAGNLYIPVDVSNQVLKVDTSGNVTVLAGNCSLSSFSGDGGPATSAGMSTPLAVAIDASGNVFIADTGDNVVRRVDAATGIISTVAGTGTPGFTGDGGLAVNAELNGPSGLALDSSGNLFIADFTNHRVREVFCVNLPATSCTPPNGFVSGDINTVAGNGTAGSTGDGGPATSATLIPLALFIDSSNNLFIVDFAGNRIRRVDHSTQIITAVAGNGVAGFSGDGGLAVNAELNDPQDVAVDSAGNVFIADSFNQRVRRVDASTGNISTFAGNGTQCANPTASPACGDGGPATSAQLAFPSGVFVDASGNVLISDRNDQRIREVNTSSTISTSVGNGSFCFGGDGSVSTGASLCDPEGIALDVSGNIFFSDGFGERILRIDATTHILTAVAGDGTSGFSGDSGPATSAEFSGPEGVALDAFGNLFIADSDNNRVREVFCVTSASLGLANRGHAKKSSGVPGAETANSTCTAPAGFVAGDITTVAGTDSAGFGGDNGPATSAQLNFPFGVAVDASGNLFIADQGNNRIREVFCTNSALSCTPPGGVPAKTIVTVAGNGNTCSSFPCGDGGPATSAEVGSPAGVAVDAAGNFFISDDPLVREVCLSPSGCTLPGGGSLATGNITTVAGNGTRCSNPTGTPPCGDGGPATSAELADATGIFIDGPGSIIIDDRDDNLIRKVDSSTGIITTAAGNGVAGFGGDGGPATSAELNEPIGVAVDSSGNIFITDPTNFRVRCVGTCFAAVVGAPGVTLSPTSLDFGFQVVGTTSAQQPITLTNSGNAALTITSITASSGFTKSDNCPVSPATLAASANCTIMVAFAPTSAGPTSGSVISVADNATGSPQTVALSGTGVDYSISATPGSFTVSPGGTATYTVNLAPVPSGDSFPNLVSLTATGAPAGSVVSFSQSMVSLGEGPNTSTLTITVPSATPASAIAAKPLPPARPHAVAALRGANRALIFGLLLAFAISALLPFRLAPTMRPWRLLPASRFVLLCTLLCALAGFMASCEGGYPVPPSASAPAATNFTVTITGTSSPLQHSTTVRLTVKQ